MVFNQRLMDMIDNQNCQDILRNASYNEYLNSKINRNNPSFVTKCEDLVLFDAFDNFLAHTLLKNPSSLNQKLVAKYRDYLFSTFKQMPEIVFESLLFQQEIAIVLFTPEQLREISEYKKSTSKKCREIYNKIINNQSTTQDEKNILLKFLSKNIRTEDQKMIGVLDTMYSILLNTPNLNSLLAKEFILKYTAELARRDLHIPPVEIYLTNTSLDGQSYSSRNYGTSYGNTGAISVNKDLVNRNVSPIPGIPSIAKFMQTICHEARHSSQAYRASINDLSYESYEYIRTNIFRTYLSKESFNEYNVNYRHNEIERDANLYGWRIVEKLLTKYAPNRKQEINNIISENISVFYQDALANKRDTVKRMPKEYYNVKMMDDIIRKHPDILGEKPILTYIYNSNGTRKTFMELVINNKNLSRSTKKIDIDKIFYDYFVSDIKNGILNTINVNSLPLEQQFDIFARLVSILTNEMVLMKRSMSILNNNNLAEFEHINRDRVSRISYLLNYLNSHKVLINSLIDYDVNEVNKRGFGMHISYIDDQLASLKRTIEKNSSIKSTAIYKDLMSLTGGEMHGPHK